MNKCIPLCLALGLMLAGCGAADPTATTPESAPAVASPEPVAEPAPAKAEKTGKAAKKDAKASKNANAAKETLVVPAKCTHPYGKEVQLKNGHKVCCLLEATGNQLSQKAARTITPSKSSKHVELVNGAYIAKYTEVDTQSVTTRMTPSTTQKGGYVGFVRYKENMYQCKGKTKKDALSAPCEAAGSRGVTEMIQFDGKKWNY